MARKTAIITGSSRGIGKAITLAMAKSGNDVVINYSKSAAAAEETMREVKKLGAEAVLVKADVGTKEGCKTLVDEAIKAFGKIDVLVNNAGIAGKQTKIWDFPETEFEQVMMINLFSQFYMLKYASKHMISNPDGGSVINVASIASVYGTEAYAGYVTSKGGSMALTKTAARDLAPYNINCNAIAPGGIATDMLSGMTGQEQDSMKSNISMGRLGTPEEIGAITAFLASEDARYITGQTIVIDGICKL